MFEPRYRQLFEEAKEDGFEFGLPFADSDLGEHMVSVCRLLRTTKQYESGESDIVIEAVSLADMKNYETVFPGKLYPGGEVQMRLSDDLDQKADSDVLDLFKTYIEFRFGSVPSAEQLRQYKLLDVAASMALSNKEKMTYVKLNSTEKRSSMLTRSLNYLNLLLLQESRMENGLLLN